MSLSSENVIYSPNGKWGIVISHEWHGMLGGSVAFIEQIHQSIPNLEQQVYDFIEDRLRRHENGKFGSTVVKTLPKMLMHVYGQTKAEKILQDIGINRKYWQTG
ncbi:MAG TPA: hypothetical protein DDW76_15550 [Cyanobacteria bacterium UBA11369]|nr:hypothetical protein [Cyanobacteria bacterium UBA11371]HBE18031.1 hypothetical protein [Cyanobacteria bacterium UBA11367]HBE33631.1 hypothetical protein [Cyanobacteria bacterium UBA11368]HBE50165.1 hypothetical protein [Cyanobacteria bacterium UBA11369]